MAAEAAGVFGEFLKNYFSSSQKAQAMAQDKAASFQEMAIKNADQAENTSNPALRAFLHKQSHEFTLQAEKLLSAKPGVYGLITKFFKGKGVENPLDGAEQMGLGKVAPYGYENKTLNTEQPLQEQPGEVSPMLSKTREVPQTQDQPAGIASMIEGAKELPQPRPVDVTGGLAPETAPRPSAASAAPNTVSDTIPSGDTGTARSVQLQVPFPRRTEVGFKHPDEATGKGAEQIQLGPGEYAYTINGIQQSPNTFKNFVTRMAERDIEREYSRGDREAALESQKSLFEWQEKFKQAMATKNARSFAESERGKIMQKQSPQEFEDIMNNIEFGITPRDRPLTVRTITVQDERTGQKVKQTIDVRTGAKVMPDEKETPSAWDQAIINRITSGQARNVAEAEIQLAKEYMRDERVANALKDFQLQKSQASIEAMSQLKAMRGKLLNLKDAAAVNNIIALITQAADLAVVNSQGMMDERQYMALKINMLQEYGGLDWNQARKLMGLDGLSDFYNNQANSYGNAIRNTPSGAAGQAGIIQPGIMSSGAAGAPGATAGSEAVIPVQTPGVYTPKRRQ